MISQKIKQFKLLEFVKIKELFKNIKSHNAFLFKLK